MKKLLAYCLLLLLNSPIQAQSWNYQSINKPSDIDLNDYYGTVLRYKKGCMIVGAPYKEGSINSMIRQFVGKVYTSGSCPSSSLRASDMDAGDYFGISVDIDHNIAVVGASAEDHNASGTGFLTSAGSAYFFETNGQSNWLQKQKVVASDREAGDNFGSAVAINGEYAIIGAPGDDHDALGNNYVINAGSAYIFKQTNAGSWVQQQKIVTDDRSANDYFGGSAAFDGNYLVIGVRVQDFGVLPTSTQMPDAGAVYIFKKNSQGSFVQMQKIVASDRDTGAFFGSSVAISGNTIIVGARRESYDTSGQNYLNFAGAAYLFELDSIGRWYETQKIVASNRATSNKFGWSVDIEYDRVLVGALYRRHPSSTSATNAGAAYSFKRDSSGQWNEHQFIQHSSVWRNYFFGQQVGISGLEARISAPGEGSVNTYEGAVYRYNISATSGDTLIQDIVTCCPYLWQATDSVYETSGTYTQTVNDSLVVVLNLTINPSSSSSVSATACDQYTWPVNNLTYTTSGTYSHILTNRFGCDSIVTLNLTIRNGTTPVDTVVACGQYTWPVNDSTYLSSGTFSDSTSCNDPYTLVLTIRPNSYDTVGAATACGHYTWAQNNKTYTESGFQTDTLVNAIGCDSVLVLDLTINPEYNIPVVEDVCDSFYWSVTNITYLASGIYRDTLVTASGCDSVISLHLTVRNSTSQSDSIVVCDQYTWPVNNVTYTTSGVYHDTLTNTVGCNFYRTLNLTVHHTTYDTQTVSSCYDYQWPVNNQLYDTSGIHTDTLTDIHGCDSIITLDLTIHYRKRATQWVTSCNSYTWPVTNQTYFKTGSYVGYATTVNGCDSIITLHLAIFSDEYDTIPISACDSFYWSVNQQTYTSSGFYSDTSTTQYSCLKVRTLNLAIYNSTIQYDTVVACNQYTWLINGQTYVSSGVYSDTLTNQQGCDSIWVLQLTINRSSVGQASVIACNQYTWPLNNTTYTQTGIYQGVVPNAQGCDSTVSLNLTINHSTSDVFHQTACDSFYWSVNSTTYFNSGTYTDQSTNASGCQHIDTLFLTVNTSSSDTSTVVTCQSFYTWPVNNITYTQNGFYTTVLTNSTGCDSILVLDLTFGSNSDTQTVTACQSYTWSANQATYTQSGTYIHQLTNSFGCDSNLTLHLTIDSTQINTSVSQVGDTLIAQANGVLYQWLDCSNNWSPIPGATQKRFVTPTTGAYAVELNQNVCIDTSTCFSVVHVGLSDQAFALSIQLYPNPTSGQLTINLGTTYSDVQLTIRDLQGKEVSSQYYEEAQELKAEFTGAKGLYLFELRTANGQTAIFEVVKE